MALPIERRRATSPRLRRALVLAAALPTFLASGLLFLTPSVGAELSGGYIVVLKDDVPDVAGTTAAQVQQYGGSEAHTFDAALKGYAARMTASEAARLGTDPSVQFVTKDRQFHLEDVNVPQNPAPSVVRVGADRSSTEAGDGTGSVDVNIAIIDTGIDGTHPDLNSHAGTDCSSGSAVTPGTSLTDTHGHGTFVAGVAGARDNAIGTVGTAPGANLWSVKVMDPAGNISLESLVCAVDWVTSTRTDADQSNDIDVANISIGGPGADDGQCGRVNADALHRAICGSVDKGVTYVVAAGNTTEDIAGVMPATYDEVLTATAISDFDGQPGGLVTQPECDGQKLTTVQDDVVAFFSNYATQDADKAHTIAAPGVCMHSTVPGGYGTMHGTSFASPTVAGTVALCMVSDVCDYRWGTKNIGVMTAATKEHNIAFPDYGFVGDPLRPTDGRYYGYLVRESIF
ncbi:S8 family serine peptidase [Georgenia sp. SYP-B2076]|uniref:S8 family peptidase n=1 Tax=Georgenia sp. SYP-B2076 TaxID=2495881 RepID=UPI000F8F0A65|nr:S8 family serine peptidase [Georgenia sp. SYP-B2076]